MRPLKAEYQILPLRVVAEESAATRRDRAASAQDLKIRGTRLVFDCQMLQAEFNGRVAVEKSEVALPRLILPPK